MNEPLEMRLEGPVILVQSDEDPGDMGEPRTVWSDPDNALVVIVPSFAYWGAGAALREALAAALYGGYETWVHARGCSGRDNLHGPCGVSGWPEKRLDAILARVAGDKAEAPRTAPDGSAQEFAARHGIPLPEGLHLDSHLNDRRKP